MSFAVMLAESSLDGFLVAAALVAFAAYVLGVPLVIWKQFKHEAKPTLRSIDLAQCPLPPAMQRYVDAAQADLTAAGFEAAAAVFMPSSMPNVKAVVRLFVNRAEKAMAIVTTIFSTAGDTMHNHQYVEFCNRFADGGEVNTGNTDRLGAFPRRPRCRTMHFPWITSVAELYRVHQAVVQQQAAGAARVLRLDSEFHGDVPAYLGDGMQEELRQAADAGYLYLDPATDQYRATLKGAYLMTWKQLPPFKQILETLRRKKAERLLKEVGVV